MTSLASFGRQKRRNKLSKKLARRSSRADGRSFSYSQWRRPAFEELEERRLLTIAGDLAGLISPYQQGLNTALSAATSLPLVGNQLAGLSEFNSILQNTESSIAPQTQNITSNGHYQITVGLPELAKTFSFDLGLDAFLQATATGNVSATINPTLNVGFDYTGGAVSLDLGQTRFDIGFGLSLPGFQGTFSFNGLLHTKAVDAGTNFDGTLGFGFASGGALNPQFSGEANVLLDLSMSFVDPALNASFNPTFRTTLDMNWGFGANNQLAAPSVQLVNMGLEADSFLQGFLGDVVQTVQKFTKPIQPFIDIFQTPVPILSAFDSSETIGTLLLKGAGTSQAQQDSFKLMVQIISAVNSIDLSNDTGGAVIPFGTITLTGNPQQSGGFGFDTSLVSGAIDDILDIPALQTVEDAIKKVGNYAGTTSTAGFQFPLLENPSSVIAGILLGQPDTTLFSFSTGRQHFELSPSIGVGIPGVLGIFLEAGIIFDANLTMGYDTAGLLAFAQNPDDVGKLLHGFYFDNSIDTTIPSVPNGPEIRKTGLYLSGLMALQADVLLAHASGGLYANINVELANTDASDHVHLDTMIGNLASGGRVFDLSGKLYASADVSLELSLPIGPDITLFSFNLAYEELLNFDPPPPPDFGVPITVIDVVDQHTLQLDVDKMDVGSVVTVQPFHDLSLNVGGSVVEADGIRVDYANEIVFYVERKNDLTTNYYNFIGLNGTTPDGVSINVVDPFRVFDDEGADNPSPAQTKPAVLLVGGKDVIYSYSEAPDGSHPNVLLVGGYGSNTLAGGTMIFGNFIPADRIAPAKAHFADTTGFDGAGQGLINSQIDAAIAPVDPAGIIGAKTTSSRGGMMMGGPGNNSFIATGAGVYEMIGGSWINSFNISPSFSGGPATYQIDGGPFGQSSLIVRVPFDETVLFENGPVPDKYDSQYKALAVGGKHGLSAIVHGIQSVKIIASPGSTIEFGDTSELNIQFVIEGGAHLKFSGTAEPDVFEVDVKGPYFAKKDHFTVGSLFTHPAAPTALLDDNPLVPGLTATLFPTVLAHKWPDPVYTVVRTFGTNGHTQSISFSVSEPNASSITLDGKGASDTYTTELGVGGFLDISIDDSDTATRNVATVRLREPDTTNMRATLTDNSLKTEFYTVPHAGLNMATILPEYPEFSSLSGYMEVLNSVYYSPTVGFGANIDLGLEFFRRFQEFIIDRPTAPQQVTISFGISNRPRPVGGWGYGQPFNSSDGGPGDERPFSQIPSWVYDPTGPNPEIIELGPAPGFGSALRELHEPPTINVLNNASNLSVELERMRDAPARNVASYIVTFEVVTNIHTNSGTLTFENLPILGGLSTRGPHTFNVLGNSGTINLDFPEVPGAVPAAPMAVVNVLANTGIVNVARVETGRMQVNFGDKGSMANIHGTINFEASGNFNLAFNDQNNPAAGRQWSIQTNQMTVGDMNVLIDALFGALAIRPNEGSTVNFNSMSQITNYSIVGTGGGNTLVGPMFAAEQTWRITGPDSGTMPLPNFKELRWENMQTLVGSDSNDTFQFLGGSVSSSIDGGGGFNTLHYDPPPVPFIVDLANGIAPRVGGTVSNIQAVTPDAPPPTPSDFDGDGDVDGADFVVWQTNFPTASGATPATGDADGDGDVDGGDFMIWQSNFPFTPNPGVAAETHDLIAAALGSDITLPEATSDVVLAMETWDETHEFSSRSRQTSGEIVQTARTLASSATHTVSDRPVANASTSARLSPRTSHPRASSFADRSDLFSFLATESSTGRKQPSPSENGPAFKVAQRIAPVHMAVRDIDDGDLVNGDLLDEIITSQDIGSSRRLRAWQPDASLIDDVLETDFDFRHDFFVA